MFACFAMTIIVGMVNSNGWLSILASATAVAIVAWVFGMVFGTILLRSINEHIDQHRRKHPIPDEEDASAQGGQDAPGGMGPAAMGQ